MSVEATHLGKQSQYPRHYDKSVLVAVPRSENREQYELFPDSLPFAGVDVWHAYEFGFLTRKGLPVVGVLKMVYPCFSPYLVESKSLKLYLNSFNMERFGESRQEGIRLVTEIIRTDLTDLLGCEVAVVCFESDVQPASHDFTGYRILERSHTSGQIDCQVYTENQDLLQPGSESGTLNWGTYLLRSNCKITHQPDWGAVFISMKGKILPNQESFLRYIVSLRDENHFHEEICEMVFKRLFERFDPEELTVACLYTRRGGIDICPVRTTHNGLLPVSLCSVGVLSQSVFRQ